MSATSTQEEIEDSFKDALDEIKDHLENNQEELESLSQCLRNRNKLKRPVRCDDYVMVAEEICCSKPVPETYT